jgi:hypothetical protein
MTRNHNSTRCAIAQRFIKSSRQTASSRDSGQDERMSNVIELGTKVHLRACRHGEPGTVIRQEHGKLVVYWRDLSRRSMRRSRPMWW